MIKLLKTLSASRDGEELGKRMEPLLKVKNISKEFPGVKALDQISLEVYEGEVLCLAGENGAGKSTLIKVLSGIYIPESGEVWFDGKKCDFKKPQDSLDMGISVVHQEHKLIENLSVAENIYFGRFPMKNGMVDYRKLYEDTERIIGKLGLTIKARTIVETLTSSQSQMVEIAKAYSRNAKLMILDEPSSSITDTELEVLLALINQLKKEGKSFIYITHKLKEMFVIGDRVVVFKDGKNSGESRMEGLEVDDIVAMMVGREIGKVFPPKDRKIGGEVLRVEHLANGISSDISFTVRHGEIVGFAGLVGAGRSEVAETIFGYRKRTGGRIFLNGEEVHIHRPKDAIRAGMGFVTEDRKKTGAIQNKSVAFNITFAEIRSIMAHGFLNSRKEAEITKDYIARLKIKTPGIHQEVQNLSGGNQQKVILSKWLLTDSKLLICDEPTKGIDVGTKQEFYQILSQLAEEGVAIMLISSELTEIIGLSNRVYVMRGGRICGELAGDELNEENIAGYAMKD